MEKYTGFAEITIPIVVAALRIVSKNLERGMDEYKIRGRIKTIETTALLKLSGILRSVLETCCHSDFSKNSSDIEGEKNRQGYYYYYYYYCYY